MLKAICVFILISILSISAQSKESLNEQYKKMIEANFETMTKGMTPEMKERYLEQMELSRVEFEKYNKLSPEEQKKLNQETQEALKDPEKREQIKNNLDNLPPEDKEMLEIMVKNINNNIKEVKAPPLSNDSNRDISKKQIRRKKIHIIPGTPNFLVIPDEKLTGLGNKDVKKMKIRCSALLEETNKINEIEVDNYCESEADCMSMAYGQHLQGGPAGYIVMSKDDINSKALMKRINIFTEMDKAAQINLKGFISVSKPHEWPELECYRNECRSK